MSSCNQNSSDNNSESGEDSPGTPNAYLRTGETNDNCQYSSEDELFLPIRSPRGKYSKSVNRQNRSCRPSRTKSYARKRLRLENSSDSSDEINGSGGLASSFHSEIMNESSYDDEDNGYINGLTDLDRSSHHFSWDDHCGSRESSCASEQDEATTFTGCNTDSEHSTYSSSSAA